MVICEDNIMKLIEIINSVEALNALSATKLPAKVSFKLGVFLKAVEPDIENYNKVRNQKLEEYGTLIENKEDGTKRFTFDKEKGEKYVKELTELEESVVEKEVPEIKLVDLGDEVIEPQHLLMLNWLIKE